MSEQSRLNELTVVLVRTRNPLNMGAVARAMQNFGVRSLRVVSPFEAAFREARSAVGAAEVMAAAAEFGSVAEAVADCSLVVGTTAARRRELLQEVVSLQGAAEPIHAALSSGRVAILFGSEKHGLTREDLDHCHWALRIPTDSVQPSMNLAQAVAVCLWELARQTEPPGNREVQPLVARAVAGDLERLTQLCLELLETGGYMHPKTETSTRGEVQRMLLRYPLTTADAHLVMGMARKLLWRLRAGPKDQQ